jgi:hypothetical protein
MRNSAAICGFVSNNDVSSCTFDTDSVDIISDTGASAAFTYCLQDFIDFTPMEDCVKGLATLKIRGKGTVHYNVVNDQGDLVSMIIRNCYYVPEMDMRLISPQQLAQQSSKRCSHALNDRTFHLRWNGNTKTIPLCKRNNLPILHTASGTALAGHIASYMHCDSSLFCL